jgi:hypothetical protein
MLKIKLLFLFYILCNAILLSDPRIQCFDTRGNILYFSRGDNVLRLYDISNPASIQQVGRVTVNDIVNTVQVVGDRLYLDVKLNGLLIFDISNPLSPIKIGSFPDSYYSNLYLVKDSIAYTTTGAGLTLINIKNLPVPNVITSYNFSYTGYDVRDSILCICYDGGFNLYNLRDVYNPILKSTMSSGAYGNGPVYITGNNLLLTSLIVIYPHYASTNTSLYDVTDLTNPVLKKDLIGTGGYASGGSDQFDTYKNKFFYGWQGASYTGGYDFGSVYVINLNSLETIQSVSEGTTYGQLKVDTTLNLLYLNKSGYLEMYSINESDGSVQYINRLATAINDKISVPPGSYSLEQNYPNPFNPQTTIKYQVSKPGLVSLKVFDMLGNKVATLLNEIKPAGSYDFTFNASGFPSGVYLYQLRVNDYISVKKMILLK